MHFPSAFHYAGEEVKQIQWNPSKADTIGTRFFVRYSEVSVALGAHVRECARM